MQNTEEHQNDFPRFLEAGSLLLYVTSLLILVVLLLEGKLSGWSKSDHHPCDNFGVSDIHTVNEAHHGFVGFCSRQ